MTPDQKRIERAIALAESCGSRCFATLLRECRRGDFGVIVPDGAWSDIAPAGIGAIEKPTVIIVHDREGFGPREWRCTSPLIAWARAVVVNTSGDDDEVARITIEGARKFKRLVLIDTTEKGLLDWLEAFAFRPAIAIMPDKRMLKRGTTRPHPGTLARRTMH